ncbi:MAG: ABC transporter substrate-binding protein [Betaproteobacteria bacterium]|nr:ABC transporter substrate-binding protein [Betaproteobacteria bacterium]
MKRLVMWSGMAAAMLAAAQALAQSAPLDKLVFGTNWLAQAEHGGFYQAVAEGTYRKHGLDVQIRMGGPQVNGMQLLLAKQMDLFMGYDMQTLKAVEQDLPVVTVAAAFQKDPAVIVSHPGVSRLEDLKGRPIAISSASDTTFWPWLRTRYGFAEEQKRPYAFSVQPFLVDKKLSQQGYATSEPFSIEKAGIKPVVFLLADLGYPPYAETVIATRDTLAKRKDAVSRFIRATAEGWKSYLANPAPGNALIKKDNPQMGDDLIAFGISRMKQYGIVGGGDAAKSGIMTMTDERWKRTFDFMVQGGLVKPDLDYRKAYTLELVKDVRVLP